MKKIPVGVGLYSVRVGLEKDLEGSLKKVNAIGYEAVEFYGDIYPDAPRLVAALKDAGLKVVGWHVPYAKFEDDQIEATMSFHKAIGNPNLVLPGLPHEMTNSGVVWEKSAQWMQKVAQKLKVNGLSFGYHNHHTEFKPQDTGKTAWELLGAEPDIFLQLDNGNALAGGADTIALIKQYPGRYKTVHLKPYSLTDGNSAIIGEDSIPWAETFEVLENQNATDYVLVEYEDAKYEEFEGIRLCFEALKDMGKA
jgi:sugar phosphate isomerase/epimerase